MADLGPRALAVYPQELTEADWLLHSGQPRSALASELAQGERLHGRIEVARLLPSSARPQSLTRLEFAVADCLAHWRDRVRPLEDQLRSIERAARRLQAEQTKARRDPAPAGRVAGAAAAFARLCLEISWEADYEATRAEIVAREDKTERMVDDAAARLIRAGAQYQSSAQRAEDWQNLIRPEGHRLSQIVSALPDSRSRFWHKFKMFQSFDLVALKLEGHAEIDLTKRLAVLGHALKQTEAIAAHKPE